MLVHQRVNPMKKPPFCLRKNPLAACSRLVSFFAKVEICAAKLVYWLWTSEIDGENQWKTIGKP